MKRNHSSSNRTYTSSSLHCSRICFRVSWLKTGLPKHIIVGQQGDQYPLALQAMQCVSNISILPSFTMPKAVLSMSNSFLLGIYEITQPSQNMRTTMPLHIKTCFMLLVQSPSASRQKNLVISILLAIVIAARLKPQSRRFCCGSLSPKPELSAQQANLR